MSKFCFSLLLCLVAGHGFVEWQTGIDRTVDEQPQFADARNYPIDLFRDIGFPRQFSRIPHVLVVFEEMKWNRNREVDFWVQPSDITTRGFRLNYHLDRHALITKLRVRWLAVLDHQIEIQYLDFGFPDLIRLRQGFGSRIEEFNIPYTKTHYPTPKVVPFILGLKMDNDDGDVYKLDIRTGTPQAREVPLTMRTRDKCKIKALKVALFISSSSDPILFNGGAAADEYNKYEDPSNPVSRRHQTYSRDVPISFTFEPHNNVLVQGISGFDVNAKRGDFYLKVGHEYINQNRQYTMSYGTSGNTILSYMQFSIILRSPALPARVFAEIQEITDVKETLQ